MIRGVIFDLGSTLMYFDGMYEEVAARGAAALAAFLRENSVGLPDDFAARFLEQRKIGWKLAEDTMVESTVEDALTKTLTPLGYTTRDGLVPRAVEVYFREGETFNWRAYPDAVTTLQTLHARGLRLGLISNADDAGIVHRACARLGFATYLDPIRSSAEEPRYRKPDPRIFHLVADAWQIAPHEIAMVGDATRYDIVGARRAGMFSILIDRGDNVSWQKIPEDQANDPDWKADAVVGTLGEVKEAIRSGKRKFQYQLPPAEHC